MQPFTIVPEGNVGLVLANDGKELPTGNILARRVESDNFQSPMTDVKENMVGIITALDGAPLQPGQIAGKQVEGHNNFQNIDNFLQNGGNRDLQPQVVLAGSYYINLWAVQIEQTPMTEVPIGYVGVVISYIGEDGVDMTGDTFKHGNIVHKGFRGVWMEPLGPGKYPVNVYTTKVENVPTTNLVLNWANARSEAHNLDRNLSTITVQSRDGFPFNLDVAQIIHIPANEAPKVIARFGSTVNLVSQVLEPTIGNYFRNSAQDSDVIAFLSTRKERQESAREHIRQVLEIYNVNAVDTLIGDIVPPEALMKTLTDRKVAQEEEKAYDTQRMAQEKRQGYKRETAIAEMQREIVKAQQSVEIAERTANASVKPAACNYRSGPNRRRRRYGPKPTPKPAAAEAAATKRTAEAEAERMAKTGAAEAEKILAIGKSTAEAYELQVKAMGEDNFTRYKITEEIGRGGIKIIPDLVINGGAEGGTESGLNGLLGLKLLEMNGERKNGKKE